MEKCSLATFPSASGAWRATMALAAASTRAPAPLGSGIAKPVPSAARRSRNSARATMEAAATIVSTSARGCWTSVTRRPRARSACSSRRASTTITATAKSLAFKWLARVSPRDERWPNRRSHSPYKHPSVFHFEQAFGEELDRSRIDLVLYGAYAVADLRLGVVRSDGDRPLEYDRSVVRLLVDEMDGGACDLDSVRPGSGLGLEALERGKEGRVDVHDAQRKRLDERARDQAIESRKQHQLDLGLPEGGQDRPVELLAPREALVTDHSRRQPGPFRAAETRDARTVRDDHAKRAGESAGRNTIDDRLQIRARPGDQDAGCDHGVPLAPPAQRLKGPSPADSRCATDRVDVDANGACSQ